MSNVYAEMTLTPDQVDQPLKVVTFFWEDERTLASQTFQRAQRIRQALAEEICYDRGLVLQLVLTELSSEELDVLEMLTRRCREVRKLEREKADAQVVTMLAPV